MLAADKSGFSVNVGTNRADGDQGHLDARLERALAVLKECKEDITELRKGHQQLQVIKIQCDSISLAL